jgi:alpha-beta hydrolase superfamily lysophospholipase
MQRISSGALALVVALGLSACVSVASSSTTSGSTMSGTTMQQVTYPGSGGVMLAGTLEVPAHPAGQRVPGVVIIGGSGSVDRDGNEAQAGVVSNLYQEIADQLAQQGIASLRYDKRGVGASTPFPLPANPQQPTPTEIARLQQFAAWPNYVGDAVASLRFLQGQSAIDPARTALIGHSEGGYIIDQIVAQDLGQFAHTPATLVLLSSAGRTYDAVLREQVMRALGQLQVSVTVAAFVLQQYDAIIAGIKTTGQIPTAPLLALQNDTQVPRTIVTLFGSLFSVYNAVFWHGALAVDPVRMLPQFHGPVLVIQGTADTQISATEDTPLLDAALKRRTPDDHQVTLIPGATHFLKIPQGASDPGIGGPLATQAATTLRIWLAAKLG